MKASFVKAYGAVSLLIAAAVFAGGCTFAAGFNPCPADAASNFNCCEGSTTCAFSEFIFISTSGEIQSLSVNSSTGALAMQGSVNFPNDSASVLSAWGTNFVYASDSQGNRILGFSSSAGLLTPIPGSPFSGVTGPAALTYNGKFLFATNFSGNTVSVFLVGPDGALTSVPGSPFPTGGGPKAAAFGAIHFLYVSNSTDPMGTISAYSIDQNSGALTPVPGSPFPTKMNAGPGGIVVPGAGKFLYVALTNDASIAAFSIDSNSGALTPVAGSPFSAGAQPLDIATNEAGAYLYAADGIGNTVTGFVIGSTGALTPVPGSPFPAGNGPSHLIVDHFQRLYVANNGSNNTSGFSIAPATGMLTPLPGSPFSAGMQPVSITAGL